MENKRTLWVFGDSHTAGHGCTPIFEYYQKYYKEGDKLWSDHLAQYLKIELINRGRNGASNDMMLDTIIDSFDKIRSGDIVIIGKTYSHRFDVPQNDGLNAIFLDWETFAMDDIRSQFTLEQRKCIMDFQYYFMLSPLFDERWNKRWEFVQKILEDMGCKVIVWDVREELKNIESIRQATNSKIDDGHMSFKGHLDFANHMWNKWFKEKTLL
jgi:hypothetical protein